MNSYSIQIADELQNLKNQGAEIPDEVISLARNGRTDFGSMACDKLQNAYDTSKLNELSELASREEYPGYWAKVDAAGGWAKNESDFGHNVNLLHSLFQ